MKLKIVSLLLSLVITASQAGEIGGKLENKSIAWQWLLANGKLQPVSLEDKLNGGSLKLRGSVFSWSSAMVG